MQPKPATRIANISRILRIVLAIVPLTLTIFAVLPIAHPADAQSLSRAGALALNIGENQLFSAAIDPANGYAYFGATISPGGIAKVRLSDFTRAGFITLDRGISSIVIDSSNGFGYFGTISAPAVIVKVRLSDFVIVGSLTLNPEEARLISAVIDPANNYAYFGTDAVPGIVVKVRLFDLTRVDALTLNLGENSPRSAIIDSGNGYAYFGTTAPGVVVKIRLSNFTRVEALKLTIAEKNFESAVIDSSGGYAYFGTASSAGVAPSTGDVVKVRLSDFTVVETLTLNTGEDGLESGVIDPSNGFAYFGTGTSPGIVVKIRLSDFTRVEGIRLNLGEDKLAAAVIDPAKGYAYFGTLTSPGIVVRIMIAAPSRFDFSLSNSGSITVQRGGSVNNVVTAALTSGKAEAVALFCVASSLPPGASCSFEPSSVTPSLVGASSVLVISTTFTTPNGSFQVEVTASPLGVTTTPTTFTLTVTPLPPENATIMKILGLDPLAFYGISAAIVASLVAGASMAHRASRRGHEQL